MEEGTVVGGSWKSPQCCARENPAPRWATRRDLTKLRNHQNRPPEKHHQPDPHFTGFAASDLLCKITSVSS